MRFTGCAVSQGASSLSLDAASRTADERGANPLYVKGTHGAPAVTGGNKKAEDACEVLVDMDEETNREEHAVDQAEAEKMDTTIQMPEPSQYMDAEVFAAEQSQLRKEHSKANDGRKTLMVSHW